MEGRAHLGGEKATKMPKVSRETATQGGDYGLVVDRSQEFDDYTVDFLTFREDVDHRPLLKGLPDDRCQCPHWGVVQAGQIIFRYADHDEVYTAGDAYYGAPGHLPLLFARTELVEFSPTGALNETMSVIGKNLEAARAAGLAGGA